VHRTGGSPYRNLVRQRANLAGNVSIASAATVASATVGIGGVVLTDNLQRGTIAFYFGLDTQTQDPVLAKFIPDAPFYRGMCYAVFHGPRTGTKGFRLGNATRSRRSHSMWNESGFAPGHGVYNPDAKRSAERWNREQQRDFHCRHSAFTGTAASSTCSMCRAPVQLNCLGHRQHSRRIGHRDRPVPDHERYGVRRGQFGLKATLTWTGGALVPSADTAQWSILLTSNMTYRAART